MNVGSTWIVVADAGRARVFEQMRPGASLAEHQALAFNAAPARPPRDRPSRTHDRIGPHRHAIEAHRTPHDVAEADFLDQLGEQITIWAEQKAFQRLIVCAPPRAMGLIRRKLPRKLRTEARAILKDIVDRPQAEIIAVLEAELS